MTTISDRRRVLDSTALGLRVGVHLVLRRIDRGDQAARRPACRWCHTRPASLAVEAELEVVCPHGDDCGACPTTPGEVETLACGACLAAAAPDGWGRLMAAVRPVLRRLGFDDATTAALVRVEVYAWPEAPPVVLTRPPRSPEPDDGEMVVEDDEVGDD